MHISFLITTGIISFSARPSA